MSSLAKKLQVKPGKRWLLFNAPANYLVSLEPLPEGATVSFEANGNFDGVQLFVKNSTELAENLKVIAQGEIVATSLEDYLHRHTEIETQLSKNKSIEFYTTDSADDFTNHASIFYGEAVNAKHVEL